MNLNDQTIDYKNAKYWCAFCDLRKSKLMESLMDEGVMTHQTDTPTSTIGDWGTFKTAYLKRPANELQYIAKGLDQKTAEEVAQKTVDYLKDHGDKAAASIANELGEVYFNGGAVAPDFQLVKAATGKFDLVSGKSVSWWTRAISVAKGYIGDIANWFAFGTTDLAALTNMSQTEKLTALLKNGGLHTAELIAIMYILYKTKEYTLPRLQLVWKNLKAGKALAKCQFKNSDDESFEVFFDMKKNRWVLAKVNGFFGSLVTSADKLLVKEEDAKEFFSTSFFSRFANQCQKYIQPYLNIDKDSDLADSSIVKYVSANRDAIENYMFKGQYAMFEEEDQI